MMDPRKRISPEFVFGVQKSFKVILCLVLTMTLFFDTTTLSMASEVLGLRQETAQSGGFGADSAADASLPAAVEGEAAAPGTPASPEVPAGDKPVDGQGDTSEPLAPTPDSAKPHTEAPEGPQGPLSDVKPEANSEAKPADIPAASVETPTVKPDPALKDLSGSLEVLVTFDTVSATDAVALQLQCATRTWNADTKSWNAWGDRWTDRGAPVILNAETIKAHAGGVPGTNAFARTGAQPVKPTPATMIKPAIMPEISPIDPTPAYTFNNLPVQTVTKPHDATTQPAFETQTRYRVIEASIGNDAVVYESDINTTSKPQYRGTIEAVAAVEAAPVEGEVEAGFAPGVDQPKAESTPAQRGYVVVVANGQGLTCDAMATVDDSAALTQKATIRNDEIFPAGSVAPPQVKATEPTVNVFGTHAYTVTTKTFNNPGRYNYKLNADAKVTIDGKENTYAAGTPLELNIPEGTDDKTIAITADVSSLEVTLVVNPNPDAASVMPAAKKATLTASTKTTATFVVQRPAAQKTLVKNWNDNNNALGKRPTATVFQAQLSLEYSANPADPATWIPLTEDNKAQLGYSALPSIPSATEVNYSTWNYPFENTLNLFNDKGEKVTYRLAESVLAGYISSYAGEDNTLTNTALNPFVATKKWADAANAYHTRISPEQWIDSVNGSGEATRGVHRVIEGVTPSQDVPLTLTTADRAAEGYVEVAENGADWTITLPNAKGYDPEGHPYVYSLAEPAEVAVNTASPAPEAPHNTSTYKPTYLNEGNHATETDKLYTGGTLTNTLTQPFTFTGAKVWADEADNATVVARPECTLVLYRYPADGKHDYTTASPVSTPNKKLGKTGSGEDIKFPTDPKEILPMYDIDGNAYVYFVKELMSGGSNAYEKSFHQVDGYKAILGNSEFLFNGGTLINRRAEKTDLKATKTWKSAARPDVKAQVDMTLTREKVVFENGAPKKDASGDYVYQPDMVPGAPGAPDKPWSKRETLEGFSAEQLSRTTTTFNAQDKFDEHGLPYRYSASETGVKTQVGANWEPAKEVTVGAASYFVTADGYRYRKEALPLNEKNETIVTNTLVANAEIKIDKTFPEGIIGGATEVTYTVLRDGASIGTKTVRYNPADSKYTYLDEKHPGQPYTEQTTIKTYADFTPSPAATGELPRYAPDGHEYRYTVEETSYDHRYFPTAKVSSADAIYASSDPNYPGEHYLLSTTDISNPIAKGGPSILVKKQWIDDNDLTCRGTVVMGLWDSTKPAGQEIVATGSIASGQDRVAIAVPKEYLKDGVYQGGLTVVEVSVADKAGVRKVFQDGSTIDTTSLPADLHPGQPVSSDHDKGKAWVRTLNHEYDVSVADPTQNEPAWVVTNRRLGTVDISLTKNWVDGSNQGSTRPPSVSFTVTCDREVVFPSVSEDPLPKLSQIYTLTQTDVSKDNPDTWSKVIENLPKYGTAGEVLHYTVTEVAVGADYAQASERKPYAVGPHHTKDIDTYIFTNTLSGSTKPVMNKIWKDDGTTIRPDLYPLLYRRYSVKTPGVSPEIKTITEKVEGYQDRNWETKRITNDWWRCEYAPMPTYTSQGYKYEYFIAEVVDVPGDYGYKAYYARPPEQPSGVSNPTADQLFSETFDKDNKPEGTSVPIELTEGGAKVAVLPAGGTVVNKLAATRSISGEKIWKNTPEGAEKNWLPKITLKLSYEGSDYETSKTLTDTGLRASIANGASKFEFMTEDATPVPRQVPKYNNSGKPLVYHVEEVLDGNLKDCYGIESGGFGFSLTNTFKTNQKYTVTFNKTWAGVPGGLTTPDQQPKITVTLVRYMKTAAAAAYDETTREEIGNQILTREGDTPSSKAVWSDLAYYAPNGEPYQYRVEESTIKGYEPITPATAVVTGTYTSAAGTVPASGTGSAVMTNTYTGDPTAALTVKKQWVGDAGYNISSRPAEVKVQLYRKTADGVFGEAPVGQPLTLNKDTQPQAWAATVSGLERYAPNGEPYVYSFKEEVPTGYTSSSNPATITPATDTTTDVTLTNTTIKKALSATKQWEKKEGTSQATPLEGADLLFAYSLNALPESITYKVQYSTDGGASWNDLTSKPSGEVKQLTSTWDGSRYPSVEVRDLPTYDAATSSTVTYRAVEVSETFKGNPSSTEVMCSDPAAQYGTGGATIGAVAVKAQSVVDVPTGAITSTITNTLPMKQITIQKTWVDEYNRDGLRKPLEFGVTRTTCNTDSDFVTAKVTLTQNDQIGTSGEQVNTWKKQLWVPVYWNPSTVQTSLYKVTEDPDSTTMNAEYASRHKNPATGEQVSGKEVDLGAQNAVADFINTQTKKHKVISLNATKTWIKPGNEAPHSGALSDLGGKPYRPTLLTFHLQYRMDGAGDWLDADAATAPSPDWRPKDAKGNVFSPLKPGVDQATGKIGVVSWSDVPRYVDDGDVSKSRKYEYRVREEKVTDFNADSNSVDAAALTDTSASLNVKNTLEVINFTINKTWEDSSNLYQTRPDAVKYELYWKTVGSDWTIIPDKSEFSGGKQTFLLNKPATASDSWQTTIANLPKYDAAGKEYSYQAKEVALVYGMTEIAIDTADTTKPYTVNALEGTAFTNTVVPSDPVNISVTKDWNDGNNQDGKRPVSVQVTLQHRAKASTDVWADIEAQWLNSANSWKHEWKNVPKYAVVSGAPVEQEYRVVEKTDAIPKEYTAVQNEANTPAAAPLASNFTIINSYTPKTMSVSATKAWDDNSNFYGKRPTSLTFTLQYTTAAAPAEKDWQAIPKEKLFGDNEANRTVEVSDSGVLTPLRWNNLPVNVNPSGTTVAPGATVNVKYRVVEAAVDGYAQTYNPAVINGDVAQTDNAKTILVTNTLEKKGIYSGKKIWKDEGNKYGYRPVLDTYRPNVALYLNKPAPEGKEKVASPDGVFTWDAPANSNEWSYTIKNVPEPAAGMFYTVEEDPIPTNYTANPSTGVVKLGATTSVFEDLTNTLNTEQLTVEKKWEGNGNYTDLRPANIVVEILQRKATVPESTWEPLKDSASNPVTVKLEPGTDNAWAPVTIAGLPSKTIDGKTDYEYCAKEKSFNGETILRQAGVNPAPDTIGAYSITSETTIGATTTITNTLDTTALNVTKTWVDQDNKYQLRPDKITVQVQRKLANDPETQWTDLQTKGTGATPVPVTAELTGTTWSASIADLPAKDAAGNPYVYRAQERSFNKTDGSEVASRSQDGKTIGACNITSETTDAATATTTITNTLMPTDLTVTKTWIDDNSPESIALRPAKIVVDVQRRLVGEGDDKWDSFNSRELTPVGNWEPLSIENLPAKNAAGASYEYRAREQAFVFAGDRKLERADGSDFLGDYGIVEETKDKTTTLKNTLGTNSLVVTKAWVDQKNKYELRPTSITLQVERTIDDGKTWSPFPGARGTVVLDGKTDPVEKTPWVATVEHLPEKAAAPGNPSYLYRAREVSFTTKDGTYQRTDNTIGAYKVAEGIPAKQGDVHANTITNTLAVGNLSVAKAWYDEGNRDGIRPSDLKIDIAAAVGDNPLALPGLASSVTLNAGNDWRADWKEVPLRTAAGSAITYSLTEAASSGYSPQYLIDAVLGEGVKTPNLALLEDGTKAVEFRNIHSPLSVDKTVTKTWDDGSNTYGIRPDSLKVSLYGTYTGNDGAPVKELVKTQVLTDAKADVWTHDFTGLPYYKPGLIGRVITYTVEEEAVEGYTLSYSDTDKLSMKNTLSPVPGMTLAKTDESGTPLAGATFTLTGRFAATPAGKTETKTLLSGGSQALVDDLIPGAEYTLLETVAPDGQKRMPGAVTIITNKSGVLSLGAATPSYVTLDAAKGLITVADPPIAVTIEKTAREDGRPLEGSYFDLTGLFVGETAERTMNGTGKTLTSQIRGKLRASDRAAVQKATAVDMQGGAVQAAGVYVYTVKETSEPAGYQIEPKPIHFVVDDQGIISVLDDEGTITTVTDGGLTLQFSDPAISVGFVKTNTAGVQLSDAVLLLTGDFADGSTTKTITSQALQAVRLDAQLIAGKQYTLSETAPPQGYAALARPLIFAVDNLGKMTLVDNPEGAASLDATCTLLTIVDQAVSDVGVPGVPGWRFSTPSGSTPRGFSSPVSSRLSKTGDATNAILLPLIAVGAGVVVVAGAAQKRRQKARRRL